MGDSDLETRIEFLQRAGAGSTAHSGRTLLEHLGGVHAFLERWGARRALCDAGLFHSVYGTEFFSAASIASEQRAEVRAVIGEEAEEIAFLWCTIRRASLVENLDREQDLRARDRRTDDRIPLTANRVADLVTLWAADTLEQIPHLARTTMHHEDLLRLRHLALPAARDALENTFDVRTEPGSVN
ncbi:MAG: hypothetical protein O7B99_09925 [Planctomycetota bacterium]|nr:hypothetical protein [Planctomycetota bacterium]